MDRIERLENMLREERIKRNCDYAMLYKYGVLRIFCPHVWESAIKEAVASLGFENVAYYLYE